MGSTTVAPSSAGTFDVNYQDLDASGNPVNSGGVGFYLFYDPTKITLTAPNVPQGSSLFQYLLVGEPQFETASSLGVTDPANPSDTDLYVASFLSTSSTFPGNATTLFPVNYMMSANFTGTTSIDVVANPAFQETLSPASLTLTAAIAPTVTNETASSVASTSATLNADVNPEGDNTSVEFTYGTNATLSSGTSMSSVQQAGDDTSASHVSAPITGLSPSTTYFYQAVATNEAGQTTSGPIMSFTTAAPLPPAVTNESASAVTTTTATLGASVNPQASATTVKFTYGTDSTLTSGTSISSILQAGNGTSAAPVSAPISGLTPNTTYYYQAVATDAANETTSGSIMSFTTAPLPPAVTNESASPVTSTTATLNANVNAQGSTTTVKFIYGTDSTLTSGTSMTSVQPAGNGTSAAPVSAQLSGLSPNTKYFYQAVATDAANETAPGPIMSFTTAATPGVLTLGASSFGVDDDGGSITIPVSRTGGSNGAVSVVFSTSDGTAQNGKDYTAVNKTLNWADGDTSTKTVTISILDNPGAKGDETVNLNLSSLSGGASLGTPATATLTIHTVPSVIQFASAQFTSNATDGTAQIVLTRTGNLAAAEAVTVSSPGGPDVAQFAEQVTFNPNAAMATVTIPINNDGQAGEPDANIPLLLTPVSAVASAGTPASATLVVHDNNPAPPPPPVTVTSASLSTQLVRSGPGKHVRTMRETEVMIQFSGALDSTSASNLAAYRLLTGTTKKHRTTFNKPLSLLSAVYSATTNTVSLFAASKKGSGPAQLQISPTLLTDAQGRPLQGGTTFSV
jgi:hypothetical protein